MMESFLTPEVCRMAASASLVEDRQRVSTLLAAIALAGRGSRCWAKLTAGFDFSDADRVPPGKFNRVLWAALQ